MRNSHRILIKSAWFPSAHSHPTREPSRPDARVQSAIAHWAPRFVSNGVPLTDFEEVTAGVERWEDWCRAWSARAAGHEELGREALADGYKLSAGEHLTRGAGGSHLPQF